MEPALPWERCSRERRSTQHASRAGVVGSRHPVPSNSAALGLRLRNGAPFTRPIPRRIRKVTEDAWAETGWVARAMSTRPVQIPGDDHITVVTRDALDGMLSQVREGFIPITIEHLDYVPPIGRWHDGRLVDADDGETELELHGRRLTQLVPANHDPPNPLDAIDTLGTVSVPDGVEVILRIEGRNFSRSSLEEIHRTGPIVVHEEHRWAELPPLMWTLSIPVIWGAAKFAGAFFEEVGKVSAKAFTDWIRRMSDSSKEPKRDRLLAVQFQLPDGGAVIAFVPVRHDDSDGSTSIRALERLGDVAAFVGMQKEQHLIPALRQAALIFDDGDWHLAWWTDGEAVYRTHWFNDNLPDPTRFLGRPLLDLLGDDTDEQS